MAEKAEFVGCDCLPLVDGNLWNQRLTSAAARFGPEQTTNGSGEWEADLQLDVCRMPRTGWTRRREGSRHCGQCESGATDRRPDLPHYFERNQRDRHAGFPHLER